MNVLLVLTKDKTKEKDKSLPDIPGNVMDALNINLDKLTPFYCDNYRQSVSQDLKVEDQKRALVIDMKKAISEVQNLEDPVLLIDSFEALERNIASIDVLNNSEVKFRILDFPNLTKDNILLLRQLLAYQSEIKGKKIAKGLKVRRQEGGLIGNPTIASQKNIDKATYRRKELAYTNEANKVARLKIEELKNQDMNFNQIAHFLNDTTKLRTRRGGKFHAKGVERLYEMQAEIKDRFVHDENQEPLIDVLRKSSDATEVLTQIYNYKNYQDRLSFKINPPSEGATFKLTIRDNKGGVVYDDPVELTNNEIDIEVGEALLLPGIYYLELACFNGDETTRIYRAFYIKEEVLGKK